MTSVDFNLWDGDHIFVTVTIGKTTFSFVSNKMKELYLYQNIFVDDHQLLPLLLVISNGQDEIQLTDKELSFVRQSDNYKDAMTEISVELKEDEARFLSMQIINTIKNTEELRIVSRSQRNVNFLNRWPKPI